jgi:hypothetical protein
LDKGLSPRRLVRYHAAFTHEAWRTTGNCLHEFVRDATTDDRLEKSTAAPQARPIFPLSTNLPISPNPAVFDRIPVPVILTHMNNTNKEEGNVPGASEASQEKKADITKLPRMEMYAVLGLELNQKIFEKLIEIEDSIEILARQKARELHTEPPEASGR